MCKPGLCALSLLLLSFAAQAADKREWAAWKTAYNKQGMKIEARKNVDTGVVQIRASARLGCATDRLWELLVNEESFLRLMPDMPESRHVKGDDATGEGWWYQRIARPPISDRDFTLHVRWTIEETDLGRKYFRWWSIDESEGPPPKENILRLHVNDGSWSFAPVEGGRTDFVYINYIELEGSLWKMITNKAAKSNAIQFLQNLDEECR
jgi:hypothetical protein